MTEVINTTNPIKNEQLNPVKDKGNFLEKKVNDTTYIRLFKTPRKSARKKGYIKLIIEVNEDGEIFKDTLYLKSGLTFSAFKLLEQAKVLQGETLEFNQIAEIIDIFPEFMLKITKKADFDIALNEFEEFDDMVKIGIFEILFVHYEKVGEVITKK